MSDEVGESEEVTVQANSDIWSAGPETETYRTETRTNAGVTFTVTRRTLTYPEEMRLAARVINPKTRMPDTLELLAQTVQLAVKENSFGLTPERVRKELPTRPTLASFLVNWLCGATMRNWNIDATEDLRKKPGP